MNLDIDVRDEYDRIGAFYEATAALLDASDDALFAVNTAVSGWSPAEHLYHIWLANGRSLKAAVLMAQGKIPLSEEGGPNAEGRQVLAEGRFERGRSEAPDNVRPPASVSRDELTETLRRSRDKLDDLAPHLDVLARVAARLEHPRLGPLDGPQWIRFVRVHSEHHHAIIRDILQSKTSPSE